MRGERGKHLPGARGRLRDLFGSRIALWVVLIAAFFAIWQLLRQTSGGSAPRPRDGGTGSDLSPLSMASIAIGSAAVFGWSFQLRRRVRRFNTEATAALKFFAAADYVTAAERFTDLTARFRWPRNVSETAAFNLAMSLLRSGEVARALATLSALDRRLGRRATVSRANVAAQLAVVYALRGDAASAEQWVAEARKRGKSAPNSRVIDAALLAAESMNRLRRGEHAAAAGALTAGWTDLEGTLVAAELRPFRMLRALAESLDENLRSTTSGGAAGRGDGAWLADLRPGELTWLGAEWPEMHAFQIHVGHIGPAGGATPDPGAR